MSKSKVDVAAKKKIEDARKKTGASPVEQGARMPQWLCRKIKSALKANGMPFPGSSGAGVCALKFQRFLFSCHNGGKTSFVAADGTLFNTVPWPAFGNLFDHAGTTVSLDNKTCFVIEPYRQKSAEEYEQQLEIVTYTLSRVLGCVVTWSDVSWHYPGYTYRILFEEE